MKAQQMNKILEEVYTEENKRRIEWEIQQENMLMDAETGVKNSTICLREATLEDYKAWLAIFLSINRKPNHAYNYIMPLHNWYVATEDFEITPLYGSYAAHIIIPKDVEIDGDDYGHSNLYFMENGENIGGFVPVYSDIQF